MSKDQKNQSTEYCAKVLGARLGSEVSRKRVARGEELFGEGAAARSAFLVLEGYIELSIRSEQGRKGVVDLLTTGDFVGTACIAAQAVHYFTARALTDSVCLEINRENFLRMLRTDNNFMEQVMLFEVGRRRQHIEKMMSFLVHSSEERLGHVLLQLEDTYERARNRWNHDGHNHDGAAGYQPSPELPRISHQTFSEMIGTTRPRVTVFFDRFRKAGLFKDNARVDRSKLRTYLAAFGSRPVAEMPSCGPEDCRTDIPDQSAATKLEL